MPGAARAGVDAAGGTIAVGSPNVFADGAPWSRIGDAVKPHGKKPHNGPVMAEGSPNVFANGIPVSRQGDKATCGHPATGSGNVFAD
jgi:uncharacterized Zn-binding protein involved in type VI secretion